MFFRPDPVSWTWILQFMMFISDHKHVPNFHFHFSILIPSRNITAEYKAVMPKIGQVVADHKTYLIPGTPQLNMCDDAIKVLSYRLLVVLLPIQLFCLNHLVSKGF